ncbi:hypothetical protein OnM2_046048 [Erysiphe neolycopersici]|uniref:Uncharacterized protein n=1 Tax=Erysiphe neolycopersici TaxID=212602 RepID=A0A420HU64_9PEZI|nr:hypothetical protein OnM2_046048 [Erysiphe neolycopersici]
MELKKNISMDNVAKLYGSNSFLFPGIHLRYSFGDKYKTKVLYDPCDETILTSNSAECHAVQPHFVLWRRNLGTSSSA